MRPLPLRSTTSGPHAWKILLALLGALLLALFLARAAAAGPAETLVRQAATAGNHTPQAVESQVRQQVASGEFGPALQTALTITDPARQAQVLQQMVDSQRNAGELDAAEVTAGYLPRPQRNRARRQVAHDRQNSGGASGADFDPLIELITTTLAPDSWDEVGGPGSVKPYETGIRVDPEGVLRRVTKVERTGRLSALGEQVRQAALNSDMATTSELRLVSLPRLEQRVAEYLRAGQPVPETMLRLGGISQVQYIFIYPEEQDLIIAGPAEAWQYDATGRPRGSETARPMLHLDDLVTVLRTFAPGGKQIFGCSINPRPENVKALKEFAESSQRSGPLRPGQLGGWLKQLERRIGLQDVEVYGVPHSSRVARTLVEADYRMKLIGVARLDGGPNIPDYFELLKATGQTGGGSLDALRWWMTMKYSAILHDPTRSFFEIRGSSVLVQSENQFVTSQGQHVSTGRTEATNRLFAQNFTRHYAELAQRDPVFADLQNVFDLGMVAALVRQEHACEQIGWNLGVFAPEGEYRVAELPAPKTVESVVAHRVFNGREIVVQVAGGVRGDVLAAVRDRKLSQEDAKLRSVGRQASRPQLPKGRWWWDAE